MDSNYDYLGEVAGKLRLLVYESRSNTPLLLKLMGELGVEVPITIKSPRYRSGKQLSLREYLSELAGVVRVESGELVEFSKMELIGTWANTHGAPHEDWSLPPEVEAARRSGIFIGKHPVIVAALRAISNTVLYVAETFLDSPSLN